MLVLFCTSLILGATLYSVLHLSLGSVALISALYGVLFCLLIRGNKVFILGLALACAVILGALRFWAVPENTVELGSRAFTGVIKTVDERLDKTLLVVRSDDEDADIQVTLREKQSLLPGDHISVRGNVEQAEDFVTDTGRVFDYDQYLASKGVDAVIQRGQIVFLEKGSFSLTRIATSTRMWIAGVLATYINFPMDGIVAGMLVGFQGALPKDILDMFRVTGTLHTLVLSGYNITILAGFLGLLLRRAPFRLKTVITFCAIVGLVLVAGAGVAAVRAGIMGSIALFAGMSLQTYSAFRALLLSFVFFFFVSPITIFVDPGFHLSFLATLFMVVLLPILLEKFSWLPERGKVNIRELLVLAFGLPIFMLPYTMYFSGLFPVVSPIANIILVPVIPILMFGGLCVVALSFIPFLANLIGGIVGVIGTLAIKILSVLSLLPQWNTPPLSGWGVTTIYLVFLVLIFRKEIISYLVQMRSSFQR